MSTITMPPVRSDRSRKPTPYRWTLREYRELDRTDLFHCLKTMLICGELYVLPFPRPPHDCALTSADNFLRAACPAGYHVRNQQSLDIGSDSDPGPDLAIVPGDIRDYSAVKPTAAVFVIEVSDESLLMDMTTKAELYATAGVPEYWVLDVENRRLIVFRDPQPLPAGLGAVAYASHHTFGPAESVAPRLAPDASILVGELLP